MADSFTDFVQNLFPSMGQVQQPMFTSPFVDPSAYRASPEVAAYYADPFRKQNEMQQASLDAALKQKQAEKAAQRAQGMLSGSDAGGMDMGLNPAVEAFLANETPAERGARMSAINSMLTTAVPAMFGLPSPSIVGGLFNLGKQAVANAFNLSQQPAPVVNMSSPAGYTADTGSGTIGGTTVGIDSPAVAAGNEGAGLGFASGAAGGDDGGSFGGMAGNTGSADAPW